jgi:hypothetical protein
MPSGGPLGGPFEPVRGVTVRFVGAVRHAVGDRVGLAVEVGHDVLGVGVDEQHS